MQFCNLICGFDLAEQIRDEAKLGHRSPEDIEEVSVALIDFCQRFVDSQVALTPVEENRPSGNGHLKPLVVPASVEKVFETPLCKERLQRNAQRYDCALLCG